jgi:hypothetical protein
MPISRAVEAAERILSRPILGGLHHQLCSDLLFDKHSAKVKMVVKMVDASPMKLRRQNFRRRAAPRCGRAGTRAACHRCCAGPAAVVMKAID